MYQTRNTWNAIFRTDAGTTQVEIEAWDEEGRAMIVDPKRAILVYASKLPGFVELAKGGLVGLDMRRNR